MQSSIRGSATRESPTKSSIFRGPRMSMLGQTPATEIEAPISTFEGAATRPAQSYWNESWERLRATRIGLGAGILIVILGPTALPPPLFTQLPTAHHPSRPHRMSSVQLPQRPQR